MNIWIIESNSGVTLFYSHHITLPINEDLVSGLLAALNQFTMVELKRPIESIDMGGLRWVYSLDEETNILFIGADNKETPAEMLRSRLIVIKQSFIQGYIPKDPEWKKSWNGNIDKFKPFKSIVEEYYEQWLQAENITSIAEFFDILGIFQQLFNILHGIIDGFSEIDQMKVFDEIEVMFAKFTENKFIEGHDELSKIEYDRMSGFNIIAINPSNCDFVVAEKQIINLIQGLVNILKNYIQPRSKLLDLFLEGKIFEYIFNNYTHLKELNLDRFLLQLFLLR